MELGLFDWLYVDLQLKKDKESQLKEISIRGGAQAAIKRRFVY